MPHHALPMIGPVLLMLLFAAPLQRDGFATWEEVPVDVLRSGSVRAQLRSAVTVGIQDGPRDTPAIRRNRLLVEAGVGWFDALEFRLGVGAETGTVTNTGVDVLGVAGIARILAVLHRFERLPVRLLASGDLNLVTDRQADWTGSFTALYASSHWTFALQPFLVGEGIQSGLRRVDGGVRALLLRALEGDAITLGLHADQTRQVSGTTICYEPGGEFILEEGPIAVDNRTTLGLSAAFRPRPFVQIGMTLNADSGRYNGCEDGSFLPNLITPSLTATLAITGDVFSAAP